MDMNNLNLSQALGLLTTGAGLLEGQGFGQAVQGGLGAYSQLNQIQQLEEERRRKEAQRVAQQRLATAAQMGGVDMAGRPVDMKGLAATAAPEAYAGQLIQSQFQNKQLPPSVSEYRFAQDQGFTGSYLEFLKAKKGGGGTGIRVNPQTGEVEFVQGDVKFTEQQSKDIGYATRMRGTLEPLVGLDNELTSITQKIIDQDPTGFVRGKFGRPEYQVAENLGQQFLTGILRKDTGAAIQAWENSLYGRAYLPQPGDSNELIAQKRAARELAVLGIEQGLPASAIMARDKALQEAVFGKLVLTGDREESDAGAGFAIMEDADLANMDASKLSEPERMALIKELRKRAER